MKFFSRPMRTQLLLLFNLFFICTSLSAQHNWIRTNPGGGGAIAMVGATKSGLIVAAADLSGIYTSSDNGATWKVYGNQNGLTETHISALGFHPTDGQTFIIGTGLGAFKTKNGGQTIYPVQLEIDPNQGVGYVESIGMALSDANVGYMAHYEWWLPQLSFLKTNDAGETWSKVAFTGMPDTARIVKILVDANIPSVVYALTGKARGTCSDPFLYRSTDSGAHWTRIAQNISNVLDFDLSPTDPSIIYASTFIMHENGCNAEMDKYGEYFDKTYKSTNSGVDFNPINTQMSGIISVGDTPGHVTIVDILSDTGTWKTEDDGATPWTNIGPRDNWFKGWSDNGYPYAYSFNGLNKTLTKDRFNLDRFYGASGQWAWSSIDGGIHINNISTKEISPDHFLSTGLENVEGNWIDVNDSDPNVIYIGAYDIGFWYSTNHGASWKRSLPDTTNYKDYTWWAAGGSSCNFVLSDPTNPEIVWASFAQSQPETQSAIFKSTNHGEGWVMSNTGLDPLGPMTHGLSIDINSPANSRILFVTQAGDVFRSTNGGDLWTKVLVNGGLKFTEVDKISGQLVYAGGENGFFRSTDGGENWDEVGLPEMHFSTSVANAVMRPDIAPEEDDLEANPPIVSWGGVFDIKADPNIPGRVYAVVHGENANESGKGLYRSVDGGLVWTKIYTNKKMRGVAIAPGNSNIIYASSSTNYHSGAQSTESKGIMVSYNAGDTWTLANEGMAWTNGGRMEIEAGATPNVWVWVPGTGLQYSPIPNFVLPVDILSPFSARIRDNHVLLQWSTSQEIQNESYTIERSTDAAHWTPIHTVWPNDSKTYAVIDTHPLIGLSYYRLTQKDLDGQHNDLGTVSVHFTRTGAPRVYPNPSKGTIHIDFQEKVGAFDLAIYDNLGRLLLTQKGHNNLDISTLAQGSYHLVIRLDNQVWHERIIKE